MNNVGNDFKKKYILSASEGHLYLTILPTEKCNFRCTYCYEDFEIGKMSTDTVEGIKNLLTKAAPTLKNLMISWFGGEPTLNSKAMIEICSHVRSLQSQYQFVFKSHMTTNGYLLNQQMFTELVDLGCDDYQITLDGDQDCHDSTRIQLNGKGSFDVIWANLLDYKKSDRDFLVMLRLHITAQNTESMWRLCQKIKTEFGEDKRFSTIIEEIKNLGAGVETSDAVTYVAKNAKERVKEIKALMSDQLDEKVISIDKGNPYICYAAMPRQLMIRADGSIGKCTVLLNDDRNQLGHINRDGSYTMNEDKYELWVRGFVNLDKVDIGCPAKALPKLEKKFESDIEITQVA